MPELPEVETARRGIAPHLVGRRVAAVRIRDSRLRWPVPHELETVLPGATIRSVDRRAKYLLVATNRGTLILHLGMSGSLRVIPSRTEPTRWDHVDFDFDDGKSLRFRDPRRFGALLWTVDPPSSHWLLSELGPEPLGQEFTPEYLHSRSRRRRVATRDFLLNGHVVAGIGNIYANEALFDAGIRPQRAAGRLNRADCARLVDALRAVLDRAIRAGGTTLRDFRNADGLPGYFQQTLNVYGRGAEPCRRCRSRLRPLRLGQRSAVYCPRCQR